MNRGVEIDGAIADDPERSLITLQVEMGVAVRMACLEAAARLARMRSVPARRRASGRSIAAPSGAATRTARCFAALAKPWIDRRQKVPFGASKRALIGG